MAIASFKPTSTIPVHTPPPSVVEPTTYLGIVADNSRAPVDSLVAYLEGMSWTVDYYNQLMGQHNDLREIDPGQNASVQQYNKTIALELKVNAALQPSYDSETGITSVIGSAIIYHMVPNVNDYFVADAGEREKGLFKIDTVERRTFNRDSVYLINYSLVCYARENEGLYSNLEAKVVRVYHFSKDRLVEGLSPVLREDDYQEAMDMGRTYHDLIRRHFKTFFNRGSMAMFVPGQPESTYDVWVPKFLSYIMESHEAPEMREMRMVSMDHDRYLEQGNIWQAILSRDYDEIKRVHQRFMLAPRSYFNRSSWLKGPIYWNIANYVYPLVESDETALVGLNRFPPSGAVTVMMGGIPMEQAPAVIYNVYNTATGPIPLIKSVLIDDYYVLSKDFYQGTQNLCVLEILVKDYLKAQSIDLKMLAALIKAYPDWPVLERFYYGPLLILLVKDSIKGFYL